MTKPRIFLDTNVILDITLPATDRESKSARDLFAALRSGLCEAIVLSPIITEVYYMTYQETSSEERAQDVVDALMSINGIRCIGISDIIAQRAGTLIAKYNYELRGKQVYKKPLTDCLSIVDGFLLAAGSLEGDSIICSREKKFKDVAEAVTKTPWELMKG